MELPTSVCGETVSIESLQEILASNRAELTDVERKIVMARFAIGDRAKRHTLTQVGKLVGLTTERVRQLQKAALAKIKALLYP